MRFFDWIKEKVNSHFVWMNPMLIFLTTLSSAFLTYNIDKTYEKTHPINYALIIKLLNILPYLFGIFAFLLLIITIINSINTQTIKKLSSELDDAKNLLEGIASNIKDMFDGYLYHFAIKKLAFTADERITLYIHNGQGSFIPFSRFSTNTKFSHPGRPSYLDNQGVIALGWESGWYFDNEFTNANFVQRSKDNYNIPKDVSKRMKMKFNLIAVCRIELQDVSSPLGIIVVESLTASKYSEAQIKLFLEEQKEYLATIITKFQAHIPKPSIAEQMGL